MTATLPPFRTGDSAAHHPATDPDGLSVLFSLGAVAGRRHPTPNLMVVGVSHSGAEGLGGALGGHPQICRSRSRAQRYAPLRYGRAVESALADYDRDFAAWQGQRFRLEIAPCYFDGGRVLVNAVNRELPGLRTLVVLRDPAERLWASFHHKCQRGRLVSTTSYESFVERCLALRDNGADRFESNRYFRTLSSGFYVEYLTTWLEAFGRRLKVVFAEDLEADPQAGLRAIHHWLELAPAAVPQHGGDSPSLLALGGPHLQSFHEEVDPAAGPAGDENLPTWPGLVRPHGTWRPGGGGGLARRVSSFLPRQSDRIRSRVESMYAGANHELALLLREHGYDQLPAWLARA